MEFSCWALVKQLEIQGNRLGWIELFKEDLKLKDFDWASIDLNVYLIDIYRIQVFLKLLKDTRRWLKKEIFFPVDYLFEYPESLKGHICIEKVSTKSTITVLGYMEQLIKGHKFYKSFNFGRGSNTPYLLDHFHIIENELSLGLTKYEIAKKFDLPLQVIDFAIKELALYKGKIFL
jgi:hypothetical protein